MLFAVTFYFVFVIKLATQSQAMGRPFIWRENINHLPWFGQAPGYPGISFSSYPQDYGGYPTMYPPGAMGYPGMMGNSGMMYGSNVIQQQPGHSVVIQPGTNGMPASVTQVPGMI
jgi:hypothetical protein